MNRINHKIFVMSFKRRWQPSASQKQEYAERMRSIEREQSKPTPDDYIINCTGDCVKGDEIAFFNAGKSDSPLYGLIVSDSYGQDKQQHTFTIQTDSGNMLIKGRNLYKMGVLRKIWADETTRSQVLDEKHERGSAARADRKQRIEDRDNERFNNLSFFNIFNL